MLKLTTALSSWPDSHSGQSALAVEIKLRVAADSMLLGVVAGANNDEVVDNDVSMMYQSHLNNL